VSDSLHATLNTLAFGAVLLDSRGRITLANQSAKKICTEKLGISEHEEYLHAIWLPDRQHLEALIAHACGKITSRKPVQLLLRDAKGKPVSIVAGHSLIEGERSQPAHSAVIYIDRLHAQTHPNAETLRRLFDLTQAEAALAEVLHEGANLSEACQRLGKSHNTLRTQLRALFGKTNTHRQIDLLRVIDRATR